MEMPTGQTLLNIAAVLIAVVLGWTLLKALLRAPFRLVAFGGLALLAIAAIVWVWGRLG
jgi:hypothetical protein